MPLTNVVVAGLQNPMSPLHVMHRVSVGCLALCLATAWETQTFKAGLVSFFPPGRVSPCPYMALLCSYYRNRIPKTSCKDKFLPAETEYKGTK